MIEKKENKTTTTRNKERSDNCNFVINFDYPDYQAYAFACWSIHSVGPSFKVCLSQISRQTLPIYKAELRS